MKKSVYKCVYKNSHIESKAFDHLFVVMDPPPEMLENVGKDCYLRCQPGMSNPHAVIVDGLTVAPLWEGNEPTEKPRLFKIAGLQYNFAKKICYRLHDYPDPDSKYGLCANPEDVIFLPVNPSNWKPNYVVTPRRVVCAAVKKEDRIITGARHYDKLMHATILKTEGYAWWRNGSTQGFVDQFGDFMTREEAWEIATAQNQIRQEVSAPGTLYSENLY
jgi:hypothetical protein